MVVSILPALSLLLLEVNSGNMRETGRRRLMRGGVALIGGLLVAISVPLTGAGGWNFSLSDPFCASSWRRFFPSSHSRRIATRPMRAMMPTAMPAFAPVVRPLLDVLEESDEEVAEAEAAATVPVLVIAIMLVELVTAAIVVGATNDALVDVATLEASVGEEEAAVVAGAVSEVLSGAAAVADGVSAAEVLSPVRVVNPPITPVNVGDAVTYAIE